MRRVVTSCLAALTLFLTLVLAVSSGLAQDEAQLPDYTAWGKVADRAETAVKDRRASNTALEGLRGELVGWRVIFLDAQDVNSARISTIRNQLTAIGAAPETKGVEPVELTRRRAELSEQLADLEAPNRTAEEAYSRADGLISETDEIIRDRQTERFFKLEQSPLDPSQWGEAGRDLSGTLQLTRAEVSTAWGSQAQQSLLRQNLPTTLIYLLVAFVLLLRGRVWMVRLTVYVQSGGSDAQSGLKGLLVSLGQIVLPVIGIYAFVEALSSTGFLGFRGQIFVDALPTIGFAFFAARWLALRLLPRFAGRTATLDLAAGGPKQARTIAAGLGLLWGLNRLLTNLSDFESYASSSRLVLQFPLILVAGALLFQLGRIAAKHGVQENAADDDNAGDDTGVLARAVRLVARAIMLVGAGGPVLAAIGYGTAASGIVFPTILSLGLLALLTVLTGVIRDVYAVVSGHTPERAREALVPGLLVFAMLLISIPVAALIWGARTADLTELWASFRVGFQLGDAQISPTDFLTFAIVFSLGYALTRLIQSTLKSAVLPKTNIDPGASNAIISGLGYVGIFLAAVIAITTAGVDLSSLAIVAGALSVGIGFGLQNIVSNFVSGIILLIERPIAEGDWIEVGGNMGTVRDISVRSTRIETFDRTDVIIPNADLVSGTVTNFTRGNLIGRAVVSVGVAYGSDTQKVQTILQEIAEAQPLVIMNPPPSVHLTGFGADSIDFQIRAILRDVNYVLRVKSDIHHEIVQRFAAEGIEIPFAQRDVWLRNPEALTPAKAPKKP